MTIGDCKYNLRGNPGGASASADYRRDCPRIGIPFVLLFGLGAHRRLARVFVGLLSERPDTTRTAIDLFGSVSRQMGSAQVGTIPKVF